MNKLIEKAKEKLNVALDDIDENNRAEYNDHSASAVEHLARAINYMYQIKESEE